MNCHLVQHQVRSGHHRAAQRNKPRYLPVILMAGLYSLFCLYFVTGSTIRLSWLFIASMLVAMGIIVKGELSTLIQQNVPRLASHPSRSLTLTTKNRTKVKLPALTFFPA